MSRTNRDYKNDGREKEYWKSRLHKHGEVPGKFTKKLTHKKERRTQIDFEESVENDVNEEDNEI